MEELKPCPMKTSEIIEVLRLCAKEEGCTGCPHEGQHGADCLRSTMKAAADRLEELNCRAEPENKPLTLEQLRQMDGEQVWIPETEAYFSGHGIVNVKEEKVYASDEENDYYPFDEYGAWLAYARKPEGG